MAKSLLEQYEAYKKKRQAEEEQAQQKAQKPKYNIPSTGTFAERYEAYKQQRMADERNNVNSPNQNPLQLANRRNDAIARGTKLRQEDAARAAKAEETTKAKQADQKLQMDTVNRLTKQYMPSNGFEETVFKLLNIERPEEKKHEPIPQVDINKKYGPESELPKRGAAFASAGVSDAPFGFGKIVDLSGDGGSMSVRNSAMDEADRERMEQAERDRKDQAARDELDARIAKEQRAQLERKHTAALAKLYSGTLSSEEYAAQEALAGELEDRLNGINGAADAVNKPQNKPVNGWDYDANKAQDLRRVELEDELAQMYQLRSSGRSGTLDRNSEKGWGYDAQKAQDVRRVEQEDEMANRYQLPSSKPAMSQESVEPVEPVAKALSIEELQAKRAEAETDIEQYNKVLEHAPSPQNVDAYRNYIAAKVQKQAAEQAIQQIDQGIQGQQDIQLVEKLKSDYSKASDPFEKAEIDAALKAAEFKRDWNAMSSLEQTGVWLGDRAKKALYTINEVIYAVPDLIADITGVDRLQWSKNNKAALKGVQANIEQQAKNTSWIVNAAGDVVSEGIRMIPTILIASMTGGASLAAQGAANIATAGAGTGAKVAQATIAMLKNPSFINSFFNMFGLNLSQAREAGVDPATAVSMSWQKALPSALIEMSGGYEKAAERGRGWMDWLIGNLEEGREEVIQGITDASVEKSFGNVYNLSVDDVISLTNQESIISGTRAAEEFGLGAVTAGVMGGAQQLVLKGVDAVANANQERNMNTTMGRIVESNAGPQAVVDFVRANLDAQSKSAELAAKMGAKPSVGDIGKLTRTAREELTEKIYGAANFDEQMALIGQAKQLDELALGVVQQEQAAMESVMEAAQRERIEQQDREVRDNKAYEIIKNELQNASDIGRAVQQEIEAAPEKTGDILLAYELGKLGLPKDKLMSIKGMMNIGEETAGRVYGLGSQAWEAVLPGKTKKAEQTRAQMPRAGEGNVSFDESVNKDIWNAAQRKQVEHDSAVAQILGLDVTFYQSSPNEEGHFTEVEGIYRAADGSIRIDINAGRRTQVLDDQGKIDWEQSKGDALMTLTMGHELTHHLIETNPELGREYIGVVMSELLDKNQDIQALIDGKVKRAAANKRTIGIEEAINEVVADGSEGILADETVMQKVARQHPGLFTRIKDWILNYTKKLREAISGMELLRTESKALGDAGKGLIRYSEQITELYSRMMSADLAARSAEKPAVSVKVREASPAVEAKNEVPRVEKAAVSDGSPDWARNGITAGSADTVFTAENEEISFRYAVLPYDRLVTSMNTDMSINDAYPKELQPRDTERSASEDLVLDISRNLNFKRASSSGEVNSGAPLVGPDMVVEVGNHRAVGIMKAIESGGKAAQRYTQALKDGAEKFGIDPAEITDKSVLVRVRESGVDSRRRLAMDGNAPVTNAYSDTESAATDAAKIKPGLLDMAEMGSGDIDTEANAKFVARFVSEVVPKTERGRMMDSEGKLSRTGEARIRNALFQLAYGDGYLTEQLAEATDTESRNMIKAMTAVAPRMASMNADMKRGLLYDLPIGDEIAESYRTVLRQKLAGVSVEAYLNQTTMLKDVPAAQRMLLEMFADNKRSAVKMTEALDSILDALEAQGDPRQMGMLGAETKPTVHGVISEGLRQYRAGLEEKNAASERFSLREPVEEAGKLIAIHNLSEAQLNDAIKLGGFAMPSIAVLKAGTEHSRYGDISVVFGKETIDPENYGNKVYGGDAWTPSFPEIQHEVGYDEVEALRKKVKSIVGDELYRMLNSPFDEDNLQQEANRNRGDFGEAFQRNPLLIAAYLKSNGEQANIVKAIPAFSNSFDNEIVDLIDKKIGDRLLDAYNGGFDDLMALEPEVRSIINDDWAAKHVTDDTPEWRKILYKDPLPYPKVEGLASGIIRKRNWDGEAKVDRYETERELVKQISGDKEKAAYKSWVNDLFDGVIVNKGIRNNADIFTPSGNRRSFSATHWAVTLENVVRAMRSQESKGSDSWGSSGLFGVSTKNYSSLSEIRKDIGRLRQMDEEQYQAKKDEFQNRIIELAGEIARKEERNRFTALDNAAEVLTEAARKGTIAGIQRVLNGYKDYYNIREDTAKKLYKLMSDISRMPTEYFEAKPERAVGLDEIRAVVHPDTISEQTIKRLDDQGVKHYAYEAGNEAARLDVLNNEDIQGVRFSERDSAYLEAVNAGDMDTAQKMVDAAAKRAGYAVKAYHGTGSKFNIFSKGDIGFHFGNKKQASHRAQVWGKDGTLRNVRIKLNNPLILSYDFGSWDGQYMADVISNRGILEDTFISEDGDREKLQAIAQMEGGGYSSPASKAMRGFIQGKGYDGIKYTNLYEGDKDASSYIAFSSDQVKLTDPVTYDDAGNIIPLSRRFSTQSNDIRYSERQRDMLSKREVLAGAFDQVAQSDGEKRQLSEYKKLIRSLNRMEGEAAQLRALNTEERRKKGEMDKSLIASRAAQISEIEERIDAADRRLLRMQNAAPLRNILKRESDRIYARAQEQKKEKLDQWRQAREGNAEHARLVNSITKTVTAMQKWINEPNTKTGNYVPDLLVKPLGKMLEGIDIQSKRALNGGDRTSADKAFIAGLDAMANRLSDYQANAASEDGAVDFYLDLPQNIVNTLRQLSEAMGELAEQGGDDGYIINQMSNEQLQVLEEVLTSLRTSIRTVNETHTNQAFAHVSEAADNSINELEGMRKKGRNSQVMKFFNWLNATPVYAFERMGKAAKSFFDAMRDGADKLSFLVADEVKYAEMTFTGQEAKAWAEEIHTFTVKGQEIRMPATTMMSIYLLSRRGQAQGHLQGEGIRIANFKQGAQTVQQDGFIINGTNFLQQIEEAMTSRQVAVAKALQRRMATTGAKLGNEVSMKRFGTRMFTEQDYFPIEVDSDVLGKPKEDGDLRGNNMFALLNLSATKSLTKNANNRLVARNVFDVYADHMTDMMRYNSMALPILDMIKWYNYRAVEKGEGGDITGSRVLKSALRNSFGDGAVNYVRRMLENANGADMLGTPDRLANKMLGRYNRAAVAANLRVALLQPTAMMKAGVYLDGLSMSGAILKNTTKMKQNIAEMEANSGIALWKQLGFYDLNISNSVQELLKRDSKAMDKVSDAAMWLPGFMDRITWATLWQATKDNITRTRKDLRPGTPEYMEAVKAKFRDMVYKTQVVDSVLTRSEFMRNSSFAAKSFSSFLSEGTQAYNMVMDAVHTMTDETSRGMDAGKAWSKHKGKILRVMSVYALTQVVTGFVEAITDAYRDDDEYNTFWEKVMKAFKGNALENLLPAGIPIVNDLLQGAKRLLAKMGVDTYGFEDSSVLTAGFGYLEDAIEQYQKWQEAQSKGSVSGYQPYSWIYKLLQAASVTTGAPIANASREVISAWNGIMQYVSPEHVVKKYESAASGYDALYEAVKGGNQDKEKVVRAILDRQGVSEKDIASQNKTRAGEDFRTGKIDENKAASIINAQDGADEDDTYWSIKGWDTGEKKYTAYFESIRTGDKLRDNMQELLDHGVKKETVSDQITDNFKAEYISLVNAGKRGDAAALKGRLLNAYVLLGYDREKKNTAIDKWLER